MTPTQNIQLLLIKVLLESRLEQLRTITKHNPNISIANIVKDAASLKLRLDEILQQRDVEEF